MNLSEKLNEGLIMKTIFNSILIVFFFTSLLYPQSGWIQQSIPNNNTGALTDVQSINTGWICAKGIYKTTNSGNTWIKYSVPNYMKIYFSGFT